jgi:hypothetical protein
MPEEVINYFDLEYEDDEEYTKEELEIKQLELETQDIYDYIKTVSTDTVFPLFDKLTYDDLYSFLVDQ